METEGLEIHATGIRETCPQPEPVFMPACGAEEPGGQESERP